MLWSHSIHLNCTYNYSSLQTMLLISMKCETWWQMWCVSVISIQYNGSHELHQALSVHNHCGWGHRIFVFVLLILLAMAIACDVFTLYRRDDIVAYLSKLYTGRVRLDTFRFQLSHIMKIKSKKNKNGAFFLKIIIFSFNPFGSLLCLQNYANWSTMLEKHNVLISSINCHDKAIIH